MDKLAALVGQLAQQGRVLLGGDMNSHPNQGYWTAVAKMGKAGYGYTKDRGVMYLFHSLEATVHEHPPAVDQLRPPGPGHHARLRLTAAGSPGIGASGSYGVRV